MKIDNEAKAKSIYAVMTAFKIVFYTLAIVTACVAIVTEKNLSNNNPPQSMGLIWLSIICFVILSLFAIGAGIGIWRNSIIKKD